MNEADPQVQPLGWRRAELLLVIPPVAGVAPAFLNSLAGGIAFVLVCALLAPAAVPGRRACGLGCVTAASACAVMSVLGTLVGLFLFLPSTVILALVGVGYLNPGQRVTRVLAWLAMAATVAAIVVVVWPALPGPG